MTGPGISRVQAMLADYAAGVHVKVIAAKYGCTRPEVCAVVKVAGVANRNRRFGISVERMKALYDGGKSIADVARETGYGPSSVRRYLYAAGVRLRGQRGPNQLRDKIYTVGDMVHRYLQGSPPTLICSAYKIDPATVRYYVKRAGFPCRAPSLHR